MPLGEVVEIGIAATITYPCRSPQYTLDGRMPSLGLDPNILLSFLLLRYFLAFVHAILSVRMRVCSGAYSVQRFGPWLATSRWDMYDPTPTRVVIQVPSDRTAIGRFRLS